MISNPRPPITGRKRRRRSSLVGGLVEGSRILLKGIKIGYLEGQTLPVTRARQRVIPQSRPSFSRSFEIHDRAGSINRWDGCSRYPYSAGYRRGCEGSSFPSDGGNCPPIDSCSLSRFRYHSLLFCVSDTLISRAIVIAPLLLVPSFRSFYFRDYFSRCLAKNRFFH